MGLKGQIIILVIFVGLLGLLYKSNDQYNYLIDYINLYGTRDLVFHNEDYEKYDVFIVSEVHGVNLNYDVKWELLKDLHHKKGLNTLLLEVSYTSGYLLNEYLHTGDEKLLETVFSFYRGSTFYTRDEVNFFKKLYEYNMYFPIEKRIQVIGIDLEHSEESVQLYYQYRKNTEEDIDHFIEENIKVRNEFYITGDFTLRERRMYENILFVKELYGFDSCFLQFGANHGFLEETSDNYKSLGYYLNYDLYSPYQKRVLNIMLFYQNSEYLETIYINQKLYFRINTLTKNYHMINLDNINTSLIMVKLDYDISPFTQELIDLHQSKKLNKGVTTDYYQYLILIKNSEASMPLDKGLLLTKPEILKKILKLGKHN